MRVIPRDLFNEAKLLKCLGQLALHVHDGIAPNNIFIFETELEQGFNIMQNPDDGSIYVENFLCSISSKEVHFYTPLNAKSNYPLMFCYEEEGDRVFDNNGIFTKEFIDFTIRLRQS